MMWDFPKILFLLAIHKLEKPNRHYKEPILYWETTLPAPNQRVTPCFGYPNTLLSLLQIATTIENLRRANSTDLPKPNLR